MTNYFRMDGWVKTALGAAIPGAQIYVCLQPANATALPPTPLANIFSDVNGLVPITQPILTDGFGHYDFYAQAGVYTIVVGFAGVVQQVYPDQSLGAVSGSSGGGTGLALQVNGTPNGNQLLLNLRAGLNQTITDDGAGNVTIAGTTQGGIFSTVGQGWFAGPGICSFMAITTGSGTGGNSHIINITGPVAANQVTAQQFVLEATWTISKLAYQLSGTTAGGKVYFGIYSAAGNKLAEAALDGSISTLQIITLATPVTLPPGVYYFAQTSSSNAITGPSMSASTVPAQIMAALNATTVKWGYSPNSVSGGIMPATLGVLTALTNLNADTVPIPLWLV